MNHSVRKTATRSMIKYLLLLIIVFNAEATAEPHPFRPGEKLTYVLRWGNIPAGEARMEIRDIKPVAGIDAYHFVMKTRTKGFVDVFFKLRERIDAYTDIRMDRSLLFKKVQTEGEHKRDERIEFDWSTGTAQRSNFGKKKKPIELEPNSLDPLSIFYFTRVALSKQNRTMHRRVTDGKKTFTGSAEIIRRETIELSNGKRYDTYCVVPSLGEIGGIFAGDKDARVRIWFTADKARVPVRFKSKLAIGHFVGELVSAEGLRQK